MAITSMHNRLRSERGVSLIHVAVAIFVITGFSAFVLDHGVLMLSRGQAQNVADAAALAGAITRLKDEPGDAAPAKDGMTERVIKNAVHTNRIFGALPTETAHTWNWDCPAGIAGWCVQVNVFRDGTGGSPTIPIFFAGLLGQTSQKMRATATAVVRAANGTNCLKPWLIPDQWNEVRAPADEFNPPDDNYVPYNYETDTPGSGYRIPRDVGDAVVLRPGNPNQAISPSDFYEIETANLYEESIGGCRMSADIGDVVSALPGFRQGPTEQGMDVLLANGPVDVVIAMFDPAAFAAQPRDSGTFPLTIVNMLGVRIESYDKANRIVHGTIIGGVGEQTGGAGEAPTGAGALIYSIQLVR